jgi:serine/threonine protein kinase
MFTVAKMRRLLDAIGLSRQEREPSEELGRVLAHRYRLRDALGKCGVGQRFIAEDEVTEEPVLLLLLPASFAGPQTPEGLKRLDASYGDVRILRPRAVGIDEFGRPYTVTRWVAGEPLSHTLARGVPRWSFTLELFEDLCDMLAIAHKRGLQHGCLEPARVFIGEGGPWLLDAGLANALARSGKGGFSMPGSPEYIAPELLAGRSPGPSSDIYSLAVILWELVAGAPPFVGELGQIIDGHRNRALPELVRHGDAPVEVDALLDIALAKRPEDRFNDTLELVETLRGIEASTSGVWRLSTLSADETPTTGSTLAPTTDVGAMLRTFSVVELRATRDLIDKLLAARGG